MSYLLNLKSRSRDAGESEAVSPRTLPPGPKFSLIALGIIVILAILLYAPSLIGARKWRAVFLANNQVYFGKLFYPPFSSTASLTDIYYLQISSGLQPKDSQTASTDIKIVKLGSEIHGPEDKMVIGKSQILFFEDLRDDSAVVKAIAAQAK